MIGKIFFQGQRGWLTFRYIVNFLIIITLFSFQQVHASVSFTLSGTGSISPGDTVVITNICQNTGGVLGELYITNQLPAATFAYLPSNTTVYLPNGSTLTGGDADPDQIVGGTTLVWDFSDATTSNSLSHIVISEVFYDPSDTIEEGHEWIELYNPASTSVNITGWTITDTLPQQTDTLPSFTLPGNSFAIIAGSTNDFLSDYPAYSGLLFEVEDGALGSGLNNYADGIVLKNAASNTIDGISYGGSLTVMSPSASDVSEGHSLERDPANTDTGSYNDWTDQSSPEPGTGNLPSGIQNGGTVKIVYQVEL